MTKTKFIFTYNPDLAKAVPDDNDDDDDDVRFFKVAESDWPVWLDNQRVHAKWVKNDTSPGNSKSAWTQYFRCSLSGKPKEKLRLETRQRRLFSKKCFCKAKITARLSKTETVIKDGKIEQAVIIRWSWRHSHDIKKS
ncbi:uncharacterized protein RJT21DRAFT_114151 [Scheffersomyces amazonensis]|uniref:uncharacterized protein n=1 Tax=Scheffersomyces amazonensis TaxID=1078765 RepID=UPI00315CE417